MCSSNFKEINNVVCAPLRGQTNTKPREDIIMNNNNRSLLLPTGSICITPRLVCPNKPRVVISRTPLNPPRQPPVAVYPPAMSRRPNQTVAQECQLVVIKSTEELQADFDKTENTGKWETAIDDGDFNPDSLLAGNEHQPLYTRQESTSDSESEGNLTQELFSERLLDAMRKTAMKNAARGGNIHKHELLVSGNGPIGWPADGSSKSNVEPATDTGNNETGNQLVASSPVTTPKWMTSDICNNIPEPLHDSPVMILDCGECLAEVTVESTPTNEELQDVVLQPQWQNTSVGDELENSSSQPPSFGVELLTDCEYNEMESLMEVSEVGTEPPTVDIVREEEIEIDLFDTLGGLKRKGFRYSYLIRCPVPYCNKVGPNYAMDNHYMLVHANTAIVDETPYIQFLRNN